MFPFKLLSFEVNSLSFVNKKLYISTKGGDVIEAKVQIDHLKITSKRIGGIIPIPANQSSIEFLSIDMPFLMIGGQSGVVLTIDLRSYEIIDSWSLGYSVHSLLCEKFQDSICLVVGCDEGFLFIRENWDVVYRLEAGTQKLTSLEFLHKGKILVVSSEDSNVYVFKKNTNFQRIFIIPVEVGVPISLNSSKDNANVLIVTDKRKLLMMNGETYDLNSTFEDVANIE